MLICTRSLGSAGPNAREPDNNVLSLPFNGTLVMTSLCVRAGNAASNQCSANGFHLHSKAQASLRREMATQSGQQDVDV
jgi:hypothetical protein